MVSTPLKNMLVKTGASSPNRGENKKSLKPPPSTTCSIKQKSKVEGKSPTPSPVSPWKSSAFVRQDDSSSTHNTLAKYVFATGHCSPHLDMYTVYLPVVAGWTTHLKNMLVKMGSSSPILGMKSPKIFELPPPRSIRVSFLYNQLIFQTNRRCILNLCIL